MLQANDQHGNSVVLALKSKADIRKMRSECSFFCPVCNETLTVKAGSQVVPHFSHKSGSKCVHTGKGEGAYHEKGKLDIFQWLAGQEIHIELEAYLPEIKRRPDILAKIGSKTIAVEYQCAAMPADEFYRRNAAYQELSIIPFWILGGNRLNRAGRNKVKITANEKFFIHKFTPDFPLTMFFYCPNTQQFSLFKDIQLTGKRSAYGHLNYFSLNNSSLSDLLKVKKSASFNLYQFWKKEKYQFRTKILSRRASASEKAWQDWLYEKRTHHSLLPGFIHLPVPGQYRMKTPPWIWQSKLCLELLAPIDEQQPISLQRCYHLLEQDFLPPSLFPLILVKSDPVREYLHLLASLHIVKFISNQEIIKLRPISFPKNVELALRADNQIIKILQTRYPIASISSHE
ncbi:competence protein CoiA [Sediminibacillus albus]|uniref:Competence protein CoiA-like family, contains a predicted nuclease domain n=1 Tax=Sediminibacillus albus TaxID=407036 RepID=A0A1G8X8W1_9BACI|nr:competence protein CoiA family protein [Sediminibacillus albus]SDJ86933.1 Competence protein CoiA-like family, contains a predicted nuclease domain [Sediminibacillus albus]